MIDKRIDNLTRILATCDRHTLAGQRDYAILRLLIENSLKRQQIVAINISDFDFERRSLHIQGKYKRQDQQNQQKIISLNLDTATALQDWLASIHIFSESTESDDIQIDSQIPLFISLDRANYGHRLTGTSIYSIVKRAAINAGITEAIAPEQLRFSPKKQVLKQDLEQDCKTLNKTLCETNETQTRTSSVSKLEHENHNKTQIETVESQISDIPYGLKEFSPDILTALLTDKRSLNTRRAYEKDLHYFFLAAYGQKPTEVVVTQFLQLSRFEAIAIALRYKSDLIAKDLKEATINRRLSAIKSLVNFAAKLGKCNWNLDDVQTETVQSYRDTTGLKPDGIRTMLLSIDRSDGNLKGKRDFAILRLLWDNALRRNEVVSANIGDFDYEGRSLQILGKGHGSQKSLISLNIGTANAIQDWLSQFETIDLKQPLFHALDQGHRGHRLTGTAVYQVISKIAKSAGIFKQISPHRIRHSAITAALEATNGNVRKVQKLSRHKKLDTLMIYDDNRTNMQGEVSSLLGDLI
jgi:integrase/recombinase XerC